MSKSTPIAQLPSAIPNGGFVNEQQRQFITQAQQAISTNNHIPQNTQASSDVVNDDDLVVQDILNQINASVNASPPQEQPSPPIMQQPMAQHPQLVMHNQQPMYQMQSQPQAPQLDQQLFNLMQQQHAAIMPHQFQFMDYLNNITDDLKLAGLVFFVVIVIHFVRIEDFVARYIAIDKIPYHQIILRAILAALLVLIVKKIIKV